MMAQEEKLRLIELVTINPEGNMNVCTVFHGNPSNTCLDTSVLDGRTDTKKSEKKKMHKENIKILLVSLVH